MLTNASQYTAISEEFSDVRAPNADSSLAVYHRMRDICEEIVKREHLSSHLPNNIVSPLYNLLEAWRIGQVNGDPIVALQKFLENMEAAVGEATPIAHSLIAASVREIASRFQLPASWVTGLLERIDNSPGWWNRDETPYFETEVVEKSAFQKAIDDVGSALVKQMKLVYGYGSTDFGLLEQDIERFRSMVAVLKADCDGQHPQSFLQNSVGKFSGPASLDRWFFDLKNGVRARLKLPSPVEAPRIYCIGDAETRPSRVSGILSEFVQRTRSLVEDVHDVPAALKAINEVAVPHALLFTHSAAVKHFTDLNNYWREIESIDRELPAVFLSFDHDAVRKLPQVTIIPAKGRSADRIVKSTTVHLRRMCYREWEPESWRALSWDHFDVVSSGA